MVIASPAKRKIYWYSFLNMEQISDNLNDRHITFKSKGFPIYEVSFQKIAV